MNVNLDPLSAVTTTAVSVSVGGQVLTPGGAGIMNALVTLCDQEGNRRETVTSSYGHYIFREVPAGVPYVLRVSASAWSFDSQFIFLGGETQDMNLVATQ